MLPIVVNCGNGSACAGASAIPATNAPITADTIPATIRRAHISRYPFPHNTIRGNATHLSRIPRSHTSRIGVVSRVSVAKQPTRGGKLSPT
ncbi:hypothetical protein GCM10009764_46420 [Nocardia ninae]|uniref:Uncharacterized protein n=1 Tax=Nocardia ninae NBRC 108245 TaxID=1210091 RepID=A0A511MJF4_9NOCA|nr:hypothetical protein NN4_47660 [Nocardia ninae NBRC 108245]